MALHPHERETATARVSGGVYNDLSSYSAMKYFKSKQAFVTSENCILVTLL